MADVTGNIGNQSVELNNAATEATLKQLLAAMLAMATSKKGGQLSAKEIKDLETALKKLRGEVTESTAAEEKKADALAKTNKTLKTYESSLAKFGSTVNTAVVGMTNLISTLSKVGSSMSAAAGSMSAIPVVGSALSTMFGAVAGAAEDVYKSFKDSAAVGANFGGSINDMIDSASAAGLTIDEFTGIIAKNGENLAVLANGSASGAKRLAQLGKELKDSGVGPQLANLGYSTADVNSYMLQYTGRLAKSGVLQTMTTTQIAKATGQYLKELDAVSKLTGQSKDSLQAQEDARMRDAQYLTLRSKLDAEGQKNLELLMSSIPEGMQAGAKEVLATGTATTDAGRQFLAFMNQSGQGLQSLNKIVNSTGTLTKDQYKNISAAMQREGTALSKSKLGETVGLLVPEFNDIIVGANQYKARQADIIKIEEEAAQAEIERQKLIDDGLDPASMEKYKQQLAKTSNEFVKFLANSGLLDDLMTAFESFAGVIQTYLLPAAKFVADHFGKILLVATPLIGAFVTIKGLLVANSIKQALVNSKLGASLLPMAKFAIGLIAANGPLLLVTAAIGSVAWLFNELGGDTETLLSVFTYLSEWIKTAASGYKLAYYSLMDWVGDYSKEIAETRREIDEQAIRRQKTLDDAAKRMAANRAKREKENTKAVEDNTAAKKEETASLEEAADARAAGPDWSNPASVLKWYKEGGSTFYGTSVAGSAGMSTSSNEVGSISTAIAGLGKLSAQYESGKRGSSAVGFDYTGGTSYGKYQIATKTGTMNKFLSFLKDQNPAAYEQLMASGGLTEASKRGGGKFAETWKQLAESGGLGTSEHEFIKKTHYDAGISNIKNKKIKDMIANSDALKEVMWSTSVQHGAGGASSIFDKSYTEGMSEQDYIKAIYAKRSTQFGRSTAAVRASVLDRFKNEQADALGMIGNQYASTTSTPAAEAMVTSPQTVQEAKGATTVAQAPVATQESPESLLVSLNSKMDQLIKATTKVVEINERQLSVQRGLGGNLMATI